MAFYQVRWEIGVDAASPEEAAAWVWSWAFAHTHEANHFEVREQVDGRPVGETVRVQAKETDHAADL